MNKQIKPGMLCLVIAGRNTGRECTALRMVESKEFVEEAGIIFVGDSGPTWLIKGESIVVSHWSPEGAFLGETFQRGYGFARSSWLLPIEPDESITNEQTQDIPLDMKLPA